MSHNVDSHTVYLSLGSNLGDRQLNLQMAIHRIAEVVGNVIAVSSFLEYEPWGYDSVNRFLNAAVEVKTQSTPLQVLQSTRAIEGEIGRSKKSFDRIYKDRLIDIDILLYDELILSSKELTLPHPLFHKRKFVLEPLVEIAPKTIHPILKKEISEILRTQTEIL